MPLFASTLKTDFSLFFASLGRLILITMYAREANKIVIRAKTRAIIIALVLLFLEVLFKDDAGCVLVNNFSSF